MQAVAFRELLDYFNALLKDRNYAMVIIKGKWMHKIIAGEKTTEFWKPTARNTRKFITKNPDCLLFAHDHTPETVKLVPPKYQNFALASHYAPEMWGRPGNIKALMELEANSSAHIETVLAKVEAQRHLVQKYLSGELNAEAEEAEASTKRSPSRGNLTVELTRSQDKLKDCIQKHMKHTMKLKDEDNDEDYEDMVAEAGSNKILFGSGAWHRQNTCHPRSNQVLAEERRRD